MAKQFGHGQNLSFDIFPKKQCLNRLSQSNSPRPLSQGWPPCPKWWSTCGSTVGDLDGWSCGREQHIIFKISTDARYFGRSITSRAVPLCSSHPPASIKHCLSDSGAEVVLSTACSRHKVSLIRQRIVRNI